MKILILNDSSGLDGGAQIHDRYIVKELTKRGHDVEFFSGRDGGKFRTFARSICSQHDIRKFKQTLTEDIDIVFSHGVGTALSPVLFSVARKQGIPVVFKLPDLYRFRYPEVDIREPDKVVEYFRIVLQRRWLLKNVSLFLSPSKAAGQWLRDELGVNDCIVHRNPIMYEPADRVQTNRSPFSVLFVGRLDGKKGVTTLVEALGRLHSREWKAEIIGDGPERSQIEERIRQNGLEDRISLTGYKSHAEVKSHYRCADVTVLPSTIPETGGLTILESFSQGTPAITTKLGGQQELVKHSETGFLFEPGSTLDLCSSLRKLLDSRELQERLSDNALSYAKEYRSDNKVDSLLSHFQSLKQ